MKSFDLNFLKFLVTNSAFFEISGKEDNLAKKTQIFGNLLSGIFIPLHLIKLD